MRATALKLLRKIDGRASRFDSVGQGEATLDLFQQKRGTILWLSPDPLATYRDRITPAEAISHTWRPQGLPPVYVIRGALRLKLERTSFDLPLIISLFRYSSDRSSISTSSIIHEEVVLPSDSS